MTLGRPCGAMAEITSGFSIRTLGLSAVAKSHTRSAQRPNKPCITSKDKGIGHVSPAAYHPDSYRGHVTCAPILRTARTHSHRLSWWLSGWSPELGIDGLHGARLAVELRNKAGGIKGRQIQLIEADDQQDTETARLSITRLIEHKVTAIVGPMTSAMALATAPLANQAQLLMISPTATSNDLSGKDDYFFRVVPAKRQYVKTSADFAIAFGVCVSSGWSTTCATDLMRKAGSRISVTFLQRLTASCLNPSILPPAMKSFFQVLPFEH